MSDVAGRLNAALASRYRIERELGPIDVWVNDAMESVFAPAERITPDEYRRGAGGD